MVLKKLADIEDSDKEQFLWLKSEIEVQGTKKKEKQRKQRLDEVEELEDKKRKM